MTAPAADADVARIKRSALIVTIVSLVLGGLIATILGVVAISKAESDPESARSFTAGAWMVLVLGWVLVLGLTAFLFFPGTMTP